MKGKKPIVLILCTGNSCRSQMAEAFLRKYQGEMYDAHSAGTQPADAVHPLAVRVMGEIGINIGEQRPKDTREYLGRIPVKHLLVVCDRASASCPRIWPGTLSRTYLPFDDPAHFEGTLDERLAGFRRVRDEIETAMRQWKPQTEFVRDSNPS